VTGVQWKNARADNIGGSGVSAVQDLAFTAPNLSQQLFYYLEHGSGPDTNASVDVAIHGYTLPNNGG
jgi:hypothetical protein